PALPLQLRQTRGDVAPAYLRNKPDKESSRCRPRATTPRVRPETRRREAQELAPGSLRRGDSKRRLRRQQGHRERPGAPFLLFQSPLQRIPRKTITSAHKKMRPKYP